MRSKLLLLITLLLGTQTVARPPTELPGKELSDGHYLNYMIKNTTAIEDDSLQEITTFDIAPDTNSAILTWNAPSIATQINRDTSSLKLGMGAVFVPRMSEEGAIEPDILIKDENGDILRSGRTGQRFHLLPGTYILHIGNLAKFPITKEVTVYEGYTTPVIPDWCALRIEVIDENAKPIHGEYDIARLDPLVPIGRGRGRDIDIAEELRIWFLPTGTYKIIGVGASLNSISNFLTVRLPNPGEFVRYSVVQDIADESKIIGGGIMIADAETDRDKSWSHNINVGGSVDFNITDDSENDTTNNSLGLSLLMYDRFNFNRNSIEINNLIKVDVSLNLDTMKLRNLESTVDELRVTSLLTYRVRPRLGPYARLEYISGILQKNHKAPTNDEAINAQHTYIYYNSIPQTINDDTEVTLDSTSKSVLVSPLLSPINLQSGVGVNFQVLQNRVVNMRFLTGFGIDYERRWNTWNSVDDNKLSIDTTSDMYKRYYFDNVLHTNLVNADDERLDYGPEFVLNSVFNLSRYISMNTEMRLFAPVDRVQHPDVIVRNLVSLHLTGNIIIDYDYNYTLIQATQEDLQENISRHRVLMRISFSR